MPTKTSSPKHQMILQAVYNLQRDVCFVCLNTFWTSLSVVILYTMMIHSRESLSKNFPNRSDRLCTYIWSLTGRHRWKNLPDTPTLFSPFNPEWAEPTTATMTTRTVETNNCRDWRATSAPRLLSNLCLPTPIRTLIITIKQSSCSEMKSHNCRHSQLEKGIRYSTPDHIAWYACIHAPLHRHISLLKTQPRLL